MNIRVRTDEVLEYLTYYLYQYNFKTKYNPRITNQEVDCLSRNSVLKPNKNTDDALIVLNLITTQIKTQIKKYNKIKTN